MNVVIFSASRSHVEDGKLAFQLGAELAANGFRIINGGGPGLMDATLRGAKSKDGSTVGIQLGKPGRQHSAFADETEHYPHLWERQKRLIQMGDAYIALPGGIGTFYELFEILALKNAGLMDIQKPLAVLGPQVSLVWQVLDDMKTRGYCIPDVAKYLETFEQVEDLVNWLIRLRA